MKSHAGNDCANVKYLTRYYCKTSTVKAHCMSIDKLYYHFRDKRLQSEDAYTLSYVSVTRENEKVVSTRMLAQCAQTDPVSLRRILLAFSKS